MTDDVEAERAAFVAAVEAGLADLSAGRFHTHAEVLAEMHERFPPHHHAMIEDEGDEPDECERKALDAAISRSLEQEARGEVNPVEKILARLRDRSRLHNPADDSGTARATESLRGLGLRYSAGMTDEAARILELALTLPESERAAIVVVLIDSIGDGSPPEEIEAAWIAEAQRRAEAIDRGELELVDSAEMMARLRERARRARARRTG